MTDKGEPDDLLPQLLEFFKVFADVERLRVAAAIVERPLTPVEAAAAVRIRPRSAVVHLRRLVEAGLAEEVSEGGVPRYRFHQDRLHELASSILESPRTQALQGATDERSRILASFFRQGRLLRLPTGDKRWMVVLEKIAERFESGRVYTEREVNLLLKDVHPDFATLRRQLIDRAFLNRQQGVYWVGEGRRGEPLAEEMPG